MKNAGKTTVHLEQAATNYYNKLAEAGAAAGVFYTAVDNVCVAAALFLSTPPLTINISLLQPTSFYIATGSNALDIQRRSDRCSLLSVIRKWYRQLIKNQKNQTSKIIQKSNYTVTGQPKRQTRQQRWQSLATG